MTLNTINLRRVWGAGAIALFWSTAPMWQPLGDMPQIPWFGFLTRVPTWVDGVAALGLMMALVGYLFAGIVASHFEKAQTSQVDLFPAYLPVVDGLLWCSLGVLLALDQQRLQPWAWELWLVAFILATAPPDLAIRCLRWLAISIYFHSALSKCDVAFFQAQGQIILDGLLQSLHCPRPLGETTRYLLVGLFPAGEFFVAISLIFAATRRWGKISALIMHGLLLLALGPWGLNHFPGVLLWNIVQGLFVWLLFSASASSVDPPSPPRKFVWPKTAIVVTVAAVTMPFLEPWGLWDHWLSWALYSARAPIVRVWIDESCESQLPDSLRGQLAEPEPLSTMRRVSLEKWCFATRSAPLNPQPRLRLAIAVAIAEQADCGDNLRCEIDRPQSRWSRNRTTQVLLGATAIKDWLSNSPWNVKARPAFCK